MCQQNRQNPHCIKREIRCKFFNRSSTTVAMATPNDIIKETTERIISGEYQDDLQLFKNESNKERRTPHLLFLGRGSSGKSALRNFLITGTSKGDSGPNIGTTEPVVTKRVEEEGARYVIHDTRGLGDSTTNVQEMEAELKGVYRKNKDDCIVIICIKQSDRITDNGIRQCFEVCNSLDPNVWDNVIVAITHSEVPPDMRNEANGSKMLEDLKEKWRAKVQETIQGLEVEREVPVCFTSHTGVDRPIEDDWGLNLITTIIKRSSLSESCFGFLIETLRAAYEMVQTHISMGAPMCNTDEVYSTAQPAEMTVAQPAYTTMAIIGGILGTTTSSIAGASAGLAAGAAGGAIAGAAAFGAVTIATSGVGALIGAGLGIGIAIAVVMVWLWIKRRRAQTTQ